MRGCLVISAGITDDDDLARETPPGLWLLATILCVTNMFKKVTTKRMKASLRCNSKQRSVGGARQVGSGPATPVLDEQVHSSF